MQTSKGLKAKEKNVMRILVVLICSLALVSVAVGAKKEEKKSQPKKQAQTTQHAPQATGHAARGGGAGSKKTPMATHQVQNNRNGRAAIATTNAQKGKRNETSTAANQGQKGKKAQTSNAAYQTQKAKKNQTLNQAQTGKAARGGEVTRRGKATEATTATTAGKTAKGKTAQVKPVKPQHFNLAKQPNTAKAPRVKFQQGRRISGSQNWQGQQYTVFRNYKSEWHDQNWWHNRYRNNIVFVFGAPYYWNAGYWFPAWGYYPNAYYAWDGPI